MNFLQTSNYHYNVSPHQKLDKPTSRILRKMWIGCRWWWSFSWKPCTRLSWNLPSLFFVMLYIPCPNFMRIQFFVCAICSIQIWHFVWGTICMRNMNVNGKPVSIVAPPPNWIIFHVLMESRIFYLSLKVAISLKINMLSFSDALEDINQYMQHSMILKFSQTFHF